MRVSLSARTVLLAILVAFGVVATIAVLNSARAVIATAVAAAVLAELLTGPVDWLGQWMRRGFAIVVTLLAFVGVVGGMGYLVYDELDTAFEKLQEVAPEAARDLERSSSVGEVARDLRLAERVQDAVDTIREGTQERARQAAFRAASYFVAGILTIFLLIYGPRIVDGGVDQVEDLERRERTRKIVRSSLARARRYLGGAIAQAVLVALVSYGAFRVIGLPASAALAGVAGLASIVPFVGIVTGFVPALLMSGAFEAGASTLVLALLAGALQVASVAATRYLSRYSMYAGPAITLIALLLGYDLYGPGGAIFGVAVAVFALAVVEAVAADRPDQPAPVPIA